MISKQDTVRINLLQALLDDYQNGNENYINMPLKIDSLLSMMETVPEQMISRLQEEWGVIKLVQAEARADKLEKLDGEYKKIFDCAIDRMKADAEKFIASLSKKKQNPISWSDSDDVW